MALEMRFEAAHRAELGDVGTACIRSFAARSGSAPSVCFVTLLYNNCYRDKYGDQ